MERERAGSKLVSAADPVVEVRAASRHYQRGESRVEALRDVSLSIEPASFVAVTGPSGGGKSTLLNLVAGVDQPDAGSVVVCGVDTARATEEQLTRLRRDSIGVVFQAFHLMPNLTALENVALPLALAGRRDPKRVRDVLGRVGLGARLGHYPAELSGGEQQRVALARALVHRPRLLVADEPTGNLDSKSGAEVLSLLEELRRETGAALVLATHDAGLAQRADRIVSILDGQLVQSGA